MNLEALVTSVVMVGHSLFGPDNPQMLQQLLARQEPGASVEAQIINGAPLSYNWDNAGSAEGINARLRLRSPADAVIVTEAVPLTNHLQWSGTEQAVAQYYELARAANPDVGFYLQETWHSLFSGSGRDVPYDEGADVPWRQRLEQDLPRWQAVADAVSAETGGTVHLLKAGQAMAHLDDAIRAGRAPGLNRIEDVFSDDIHPNDTGFYYLSLFQYAVLTGTSPKGLPYQLKDRWGGSYDAPSAALASALQDIAWEAAGAAAKPGTAAKRIPARSGQRAELPPDPAPLPEDPALPRLAADAQAAAPDPAATDGGPLPAPLPAKAVKQPLAMNLMGIADWSPQAPFLDHFKTARPWIGHLPGQWGGAGHQDLETAGYLDADGWPVAIPPELGSIGTVILTDMPKQAASLAGRYVLRFDGKGIVEVSGRAKNVRYGKGEVRFDYTPGPGVVDIRIQRSGSSRNAGDYVRNIRVVKEDQLASYDAGALFNPLWLGMLDGFAALRFMDWMATNNSAQIGWEDRPQPGDYTWARNGVPAEIMLMLSNQLGADPWFTLPHMADDSYMRNFAALAEAQLDEDLKVYAEFSNEVWNWQFEQARWADEQARARWGGADLWMQFYGGRAAEMAQIWSAVFGPEQANRLVRVISTQTGWLGLEEQLLTAPLWVAEDPGRSAPAKYFDAYAVTGYFGGILGLEQNADVVREWISDSRAHAAAAADANGLAGAAADEFMLSHQYDTAAAQAGAELRDGLALGDGTDTLADLLGRVLPYHADAAARHGLDLIMYEGGSHVVGIGPMIDDEELTGFFTRFNYSAEMGGLYSELLAGWHSLGGVLFAAYADVATPGKWGSWGTRRWLGDQNPRWQALEATK